MNTDEHRSQRGYLCSSVFIRGSKCVFREMRVEGTTLVCSDGADLCPDVLIWGGLPPAETASDAA
jgi:hypothetical protein